MNMYSPVFPEGGGIPLGGGPLFVCGGQASSYCFLQRFGINSAPIKPESEIEDVVESIPADGLRRRRRPFSP